MMVSAESDKVVFVEDDEALRRAIIGSFTLAGLTPLPFDNAGAALAALDRNFPGVVVTDIRLPGMDGLEFLARARALDRELPVILVSGHADVPIAVRALREGAYDFLTKPFSVDRLIAVTRQALEARRGVTGNRALALARHEVEAADSPLIGASSAMEQLRATIAHVAKANLDVLIEGETGTGKELVATLLHRQSPRRARPFIAVNCGAVPDALAETVLFGQAQDGSGYRRPQHVGRIEASDRGTLFLDEIDSMSPSLQVKLLRVLEEREITPLGGGEAQPVDLRVVAASKVGLHEAARRGEFREDLLYRLDVIRLRLPPLRERPADILPLFAHFVEEGLKRSGARSYIMTDAVRRRLLEHDWPGNVRELRNFAFSSVLELAPPEAGKGTGTSLPAAPGVSLAQRMDAFEASVVREAMEAAQGNMNTAMSILGLPRKTLYSKLSKHGIDPRAYRAKAGRR